MVRHRLAHVLVALLMVLLTVPAGARARQGDPVLIETLLEVSLPAASIPTGPLVVALNYWTWEPDATASVPTGAWAQGIVIDHVLTGCTRRQRRRGPARPCRRERTGRGGRPGDGVCHRRRDGVAYLQNEASWEFRNGGAEQGAGLGGGNLDAAADNPGPRPRSDSN